MRFIAMTLTAFVLGLGVSDCEAGSNPLIGKWQATHGDMSTITHSNKCINDSLVFTQKAQTMHTIAMVGNGDYSRTVPVTYATDISPNMVFVYYNGNSATSTGFTILDANSIRVEDAGRCIYRRVG